LKDRLAQNEVNDGDYSGGPWLVSKSIIVKTDDKRLQPLDY